jgi:hypothetical protein
MKQKGTTLIETLIAAAIFVVFSIAIYQVYVTIINLSSRIRAKTVATEVVSEQFEFIRNLPYTDVGTVAGIPSGVVVPSQTVTRSGFTFSLGTVIRNIDQPADGTLGGTPNDLSPADNKLIEISATCTNCKSAISVSYSSYIAPKNLETENGNGAMVIKAIDANGQPIVGATVRIKNTALSPNINITDVTDMTGVLTIVDAPPSTEAYEISVLRDGYSVDKTYPLNDVANPNPTKPHLTVVANTVSQSSFSIDAVSSIAVKTQNLSCAAVGGVATVFTGGKTIGTNPVVLKTVKNLTTDGSGSGSLTNVEWDTYAVTLGGTTYDIVGTNPILPLAVPPGSSQQLTISVSPGVANRFVIGVVDVGGLPIAGAEVAISGPSGSFTKTTNLGSVSQSEWSGGVGQDTFINSDQFLSADASINYSDNPGELKLVKTGATYATSGSLTSSTFDIGTTANFSQLTWAPITQPGAAGATPVRFQIATNNDNTTWDFVGPDGTATSYYTDPLATINSIHNGNRYIRYKVFLSTNDSSVTPSVSDIGITYTAGCLPPGQVNFGGLQSGSYNVTVSKSGYTTQNKTIILQGDTYEIIPLSL